MDLCLEFLSVPYTVCANSKSSGKTVNLCRLTRVFSCNNVALTDFGSWSELQHHAIPANDAKQEFWWETKFITESKTFKRKQHILRNKVLKNQIIINSTFEMHIFRVRYVLMHLRWVVLVCGVSMVTEKVWNKIFTTNQQGQVVIH